MDLLYLGYIRQMPRLYVCQSTGSDGISKAWSRHREALFKVKEAEVEGESVARSRYTVEADPSEGVRERIASHTIGERTLILSFSTFVVSSRLFRRDRL